MTASDTPENRPCSFCLSSAAPTRMMNSVCHHRTPVLTYTGVWICDRCVDGVAQWIAGVSAQLTVDYILAVAHLTPPGQEKKEEETWYVPTCPSCEKPFGNFCTFCGKDGDTTRMAGSGVRGVGICDGCLTRFQLEKDIADRETAMTELAKKAEEARKNEAY